MTRRVVGSVLCGCSLSCGWSPGLKKTDSRRTNRAGNDNLAFWAELTAGRGELVVACDEANLLRIYSGQPLARSVCGSVKQSGGTGGAASRGKAKEFHDEVPSASTGVL